jgi:ribosome biogenesis SPOUT family RNA methylase Rps3
VTHCGTIPGILLVCPDACPVPLAEIPYLDFPELKFNEHESTQMPFRYVKGDDDKPIMPKVGTPKV